MTEVKSPEPCFLSIESKPAGAVALAEDLGCTWTSSSAVCLALAPSLTVRHKAGCDSKSTSVKALVTVGLPFLLCRGRLCFHSPSFPPKAFSEPQPCAATVPGAGDAETEVTAPASKLLIVQEEDRQPQVW